MKNQSLQMQQLSSKMELLSVFKKLDVPSIGWLKTTRVTLGMSLEQFGAKLSITKQGAQSLELREAEKSITLKSLAEAANAIDMELVYGLIPKDGTLENLIERKAKALAKQIILRTSNSMILEDQGNSEERIEKAFEELATQIKNEMPKALWD